MRELENALTRAAILARGAAIGTEHLTLGVDYPGRGARSAEASAGSPRTNGSDTHAEVDGSELDLEHVIALHVRRVLERTDGNKSETARLLGISRSRLQRYVDKFDL